MTKSYIKGYIEFFCGKYGNGLAWCEHISSLLNERTGRIEVTPYETKRGRQTYKVVTITYCGPDITTTTERKGVSLTRAVELFREWDKGSLTN